MPAVSVSVKHGLVTSFRHPCCSRLRMPAVNCGEASMDKLYVLGQT